MGNYSVLLQTKVILKQFIKSLILIILNKHLIFLMFKELNVQPYILFLSYMEKI